VSNELMSLMSTEEKIHFLLGQLEQKDAVIKHLQEQLHLQIEANQRVPAKFRDREQKLLTEISLLQRGVRSACVCPAGKCFKLAAPGQLCWAQWAGLTAIRDVAQRAVDEALRGCVHPRQTGPDVAQTQIDAVKRIEARETQQGKVSIPHVCSFLRDIPTGKRFCTSCGKEEP
jgi:hypothetical protein